MQPDNRQPVRYRFLCRTFLCYVPLAGVLGIWGWQASGLAAVAKVGAIAAGLFIWTLVEYLLHRFLLHSWPQAPAILSVVERLHLGHHRDPRDEAKITVPVSGSLPIAAALLGLFRLAVGQWEVAALLMVGSVAGYLYYEAVHFWIHCSHRSGRWLGRRRAHHLLHHFKDQRRGFGVSTRLWDLAIGTYEMKSERQMP
jgi:sterol desaturase/sphingolipid hydroxylase (fatty acid hydroxylase superfamily)